MLQDQSRNRTPMPGAQAPAAAPPDTGPARAEAGIAAMLSKPEPEFVRVSQAALIKALSGDVSAAVRSAIEDHAHALKAGEDEPDHSDEAFERHSARQNETDEHLRSVRCQSLSDLRAKLIYLIPVSRPDLLDQRVGDHLEGLLADVDALSQTQADPEPIGVDPIFAALAESRHLYADWMGAYDAWPHPGLEPRDVMARISGGGGAFMDHLSKTVLTTVPTSLTGCAALGRYVLERFEREEIDGDEHGKLGLETIVEGLQALPVKAVAAYPPMHADEISLARMVVDYFGPKPIDPWLTGDIALRDRAQAILAASTRDTAQAVVSAPGESSVIRSGFIETRAALNQALALEAASTGNLPDAWGDARDTAMKVFREQVLALAPTSLDDCRAVARLLLDLRAGLGLDLQEEATLLIERTASESPTAAEDTVKAPTTAVFDAIRTHEEARNRDDELGLRYDSMVTKKGQQQAAAGEINAAEAAADAAADQSEQAWRDLFKTQPKDLHELWLLLAHIEKHHAAHHGMADAPNIWGTLTGAVAAVRTAKQAPKVLPHDLSKLSVPQLSSLYDICWQQRDILLAIESEPRCVDASENGFKTNTPLGDIVETEGARFAFLGDDVVSELERRRPTNNDDRNLILETRIRHDLNCNCAIGSELVADIIATWGAK